MATPARMEEGYEMDLIHEVRSRQQSPRAPSQPGSASAHSEGHQSPTGQPAATSEESLGYSNFRKASDIKDAAPKGWPSVAAIQFYYPNFSIHRRFSFLMQRILTDQETKLAYLETKLEELDKEDERIDASRLNLLPFDTDRLLAACRRTRYQPPASEGPSSSSPHGSEGQEGEQAQGEEPAIWIDKDLLLEAMVPRIKNYIELLQLDKEMQKLPAISRREHKIFYDEIRNHHLDGPARQFLHPQDDFITTVTDRVHQIFEAFVYGESPIVSRIKRFIGRERSNHSHVPVLEIDKRRLVFPIKVTTAFTSGVLLLAPVAILFLGDLSKRVSFVVVVIFLFAFVAVMSYLKTNWDTMLVGLSAYMAVLVTFLSNLEQGKN
ncbi:hypothetical protein F4818DRAFT_373295 [Hypoxylon cercidicola]|nr:hypothetical protein F4818DRAFT_373295 [Hypoxylon cercidicola]